MRKIIEMFRNSDDDVVFEVKISEELKIFTDAYHYSKRDMRTAWVEAVNKIITGIRKELDT
jgi:adenosine deaminase